MQQPNFGRLFDRLSPVLCFGICATGHTDRTLWQRGHEFGIQTRKHSEIGQSATHESLTIGGCTVGKVFVSLVARLLCGNGTQGAIWGRQVLFLFFFLLFFCPVLAAFSTSLPDLGNDVLGWSPGGTGFRNEPNITTSPPTPCTSMAARRLSPPFHTNSTA